MTKAKSASKKSQAEALSDEEYSRLSAILASQKQLGHYPLTVKRLRELSPDRQPGDAALAHPKAGEHFLTTAVKGATQAAAESALVFLSDDLPRLAGYARTLRYFIERRLSGKKSQSCTVDQMLEKGCNSRVRDALKSQLKERLAARRLPPGIGALQVGASRHLFIFDQIIGSPEVASTETPIEPIAPCPAPDALQLAAEASSVQGDSTRTAAVAMAPTGAGDAPPVPEAAIRPTAMGLVHAPGTSPPRSDPARSNPIQSAVMAKASPEADEATAEATLDRRLQVAFDLLDGRSGGNNQVLLYDLRAEVGVAREPFDACLEKLRRDGVFTLSAEEGRFGRLAPEKVEAGIEGPSGRLVYVARR